VNPHPPSTLQLLRVLCLEDGAASRALAAHRAASVTLGAIEDAGDHQVVLLQAADVAAMRALTGTRELARWAYDHAVVVVSPAADEEVEAELQRLGVEAIVPLGLPAAAPSPAAAAELARALRHAHQRKQLERATRTAYATDLTTGLPHQAQLLEHVTQLIALRERESAPLVLIALRIEGVAQATAHLGDEAANVLRRKVAVRLRGGLRASDVVASLGTDLFAVMLGRVDMVSDGEGVAAKLLRALEQPFVMAGREVHLGAAVGIANYPAHGKDANALLKRATAQAAMVATVDEQGVATVQSGFVVLGGGAANDPA
jgi:diguanylate cyclase (GGDEF)-like protein